MTNNSKRKLITDILRGRKKLSDIINPVTDLIVKHGNTYLSIREKRELTAEEVKVYESKRKTKATKGTN